LREKMETQIVVFWMWTCSLMEWYLFPVPECVCRRSRPSCNHFQGGPTF
jgi:hypothetical protein